MKNTKTKTNKTVLCGTLFAVLVISLTSVNSAHAITADEEQLIDDLGWKIVEIQQNNIKYATLEQSPELDELIQSNLDRIDVITAQLDKIAPSAPAVKVSPEMEKKMNEIRYHLMESDLPLLEIYINPSTGKLTVTVDKDKSTDLSVELNVFIKNDFPLEIRYAADTAEFQGACNSSTNYCDPLIGGSLGEDKNNGLDCTISIAVVNENTWPYSDEDGIIIPDHCNPDTSNYYQADKDAPSHNVGPETKDGGWYCDCDFIKSDSRTIDTAKINNNYNDVSLDGFADIPNNKWVDLYGFVSGYDTGKVAALDVSKQFNGNWFDHLYKIQYVDYTDGDSGAPVIYNSKYGGMNIGKDVEDGTTYNYAHEWTFLEDKLDLDW